MPEKEPQFTVTDRRKFTQEGELREGGASQSEPETATAAESAPVESAPAGARPEPPPSDLEAVSGEDSEMEEGAPDPTAEESARQTKDYHASARQLDDLLRQANPGGPASTQMNFDRLVQSIYMTAAVQMGAGGAPEEQPRIDIVGARQSIDMLGVLEEKTKGNLTDDERRLLQNALFDLRMSFLEITNAIASSAQRPPKPGMKV